MHLFSVFQSDFKSNSTHNSCDIIWFMPRHMFKLRSISNLALFVRLSAERHRQLIQLFSEERDIHADARTNQLL